jgi:hypothetical protein
LNRINSIFWVFSHSFIEYQRIDEYISNYNNFTKSIVFNFGLGKGGIGDLTKFFMYLFELCIANNIKLYYLLTNNKLDDYFKLKYNKMYISSEEIKNHITISDLNELSNLKSDIYYFVEPYIFYDFFTFKDETKLSIISYPLDRLFYFTDSVIMNANKYINNQDKYINNQDKYISIHLRLGDKYLETSLNNIICPDDERIYDEQKLFNFIEINSNKNIYFFCECKEYKLKIKDKYKFINITDYDICHTGLRNNSELQILNTVTDFYLLSYSKHIYKASYSGFSIMASKFKNIPIDDI